MTSRLTAITPEHLRAWGACYSDSDIASLYAGRESLSPVEVLDLDVPAEDRLRIVLRPEVLGERDLRLAACAFAERVISIYEAQHPDDDRPRRAIETARHFAVGEASEAELEAAYNAAEDAADAAVRFAAWAPRATPRADAARAAWAAAWAAWAAPRADAAMAAWDAARTAARATRHDGDAERKVQVAIVRGYLERAGVVR